MSSPFPGMDPYLETASLWPEFHQALVAAIHQSLASALADRYRAKVATRSYSVELVLFTSVTRDPRTERYVEILTRTDPRMVTLIDVVSPTAKATADGRAAYLRTRAAAQRAGANLVEIDLVLGGTPTLDFDRSGLPEWDYAVTVTRAAAPDRHEIYTATLQKPLPKFRLPLLADHRDVLVDLQSAFARAYEAGPFAAAINYGADPNAALDDADRVWLRDHLIQQGLRRS